MGQFEFDVPDNLVGASGFGPDQALWQWAYVVGLENVPWEACVRFDGRRLSLQREIDESGKLLVPWDVEGYGPVTLSTCSLRPGPEPYLLPRELARGSCFRVRSQADVWQRAGLRTSENYEDLLSRGTSLFLDSVLHQDREQSGEAAMKAIRHLEAASADLVESYAAQALAYRRQTEGQLGTLTAATVLPNALPTGPQEAQYLNAFNSAAVRISWADVESDAGRLDFDAADAAIGWCQRHGLRIVAGPLFDFQERMLPHWLYLFEDHFAGLLETVCRFTEQAVRRYAGRVHLWNCAAGLNTCGPIALSEEQVMRLTVAIIQVVRRTDPRTPIIVTFDQPWGEYLSRDRHGISPLHCADALVRSGLGVAGIGLEFRMNYKGIGTLPRTVLDFSQLLDRWSSLGLPLLCQLSMPAATGADENAIRPADTIAAHGGRNATAQDQMRLGGGLIRAMLAKNFVHGIVWEGWDDSRRHVLPHSGLIDASGAVRPLQQYFARLRKDFLC